MSTDYDCWDRDGIRIWIWEGSSQFRIGMDNKNCVDAYYNSETIETRGERLTPEQVVEIALKLLQPTLYNVEDPKKFHEEIIKKVRELVS